MEIVSLPAKGKTIMESSKKRVRKTHFSNDPNTIIPQNDFDQINASKTKYIDNHSFDKTTYYTFQKKSEALEYIKKNNKLKLFCEDICEENASKRFIASTYDNIYVLSKNKKSHIYECYENEQPLKLILDIDYKITNDQKNHHNINTFDDMLVICIDTITDKLKEYTHIDPLLIVLKSCRKDKLSAHIVFHNIHFKNILMMKCFIMSIDSQLIREKVIDPNIYRTGCMRLLWNSKYGRSNILEYDECKFMTNQYTVVNDYQLFMDCMLTNISYDSQLIDMKIDIVVNRNNKKKTVVKKDIEIKNNVDIKYDVKLIKQYLDLIDVKRADDYNEWIRIGMAIHNSNSSEEGFCLWDHWSSSSDKYSGAIIGKWKWNSFNDNGLTINTLKYYAKQDNHELYDQLNHDHTDNEKFNAYIINCNYLLEKDEKIKDKKSIITQKICNWYDDPNIKSIVIKSAYNTGKTTMIRSIFNEFNPKRILFITHRQSLTNELYGAFKKYRLCNYLNGSFDANRLICQIESLHKIFEHTNPYHHNNNGQIIPYDLIILDEIESLLNHMMSPTIQNKQQTFELMCRIIRDSKKILALDGDFSNRGYDYINNFGKSIIIRNTMIKDKKKYIFVNNQKYFNKEIDESLNSKKNIVVVTMSSKQGKILYEKYKDKYNTIFHSSKTDDTMKDLLLDVETNWKCSLLIYSPSIQSGVSFDAPHFDKMFVILSSKSCSPRDVCQMTHRIRQFNENNVLIYLNGLPYREEAKFYRYDMMSDFVNGIYKKHSFSTDSLYNKILTHNEVENINKSPLYFVAMYIKYIKEKGSHYEYLNNTEMKVSKKIKEIDFNIQGIVDAEDINCNTYKEYMRCQSLNMATEKQKYAIEKYLYRKYWNVDTVDESFMERWFRKTYILDNLKYLLNVQPIDSMESMTTVDQYNNDNYLIYGKAKQKQRIEMVRELIDNMGFNLENIGNQNMLSREVFTENIKRCIEKCKIFTDPTNSEILFGIKLKEIESVKAFMGFVNSSLLKKWGLFMGSNKKTVRDKNTKKVISYHVYNLNYLQEIDIYL